MMTQDQITGFIRHIATFAGGFLLARGKIDTQTLEMVVGAIATLGGVIWSYTQKAATKPPVPPTPPA